MPRRKMRTYNQMVEPNAQYEDERTIDGEAVPVQRGGPRWPLLVGVVIVIALVTVAIINRGTLAAPNIMAYSEDNDPYQTDAQVIRQRSMYHIKASMNCEDIVMEPLGTIGGLWSVKCIQERTR